MNVYLDSMQWIYFFEQNPLFYPQTRSMILRAQQLPFEPSDPGRDPDRSQKESRHLHRYKISSLPFPRCESRPFGADTAEHFADIRASTRVKPADALHLALAASAGTDYFVTTDTRLHSLTIPGISRICPPNAVP
jgi:hypothetical protein